MFLGCKWKDAFEYVKEKRAVCAPNTAFTCNLIEIGEIFSGHVSSLNLIFRCAYHLPHDPSTAVLKLCRNSESRKVLTPATSLLDPRGVFVVRALRDADTSSNEAKQEHYLFMWCGREATEVSIAAAERLAKNMFGILSRSESVTRIQQGEEPLIFFDFVVNDGPFNSDLWQDFYDIRPTSIEPLVDVPVAARNFEINIREIEEKRRPSLTLPTPLLLASEHRTTSRTESLRELNTGDSPKVLTSSTAPNTFQGELCESPPSNKSGTIPPINMSSISNKDNYSEGESIRINDAKVSKNTVPSLSLFKTDSIDRNSPRSTRIDLSVVATPSDRLDEQIAAMEDKRPPASGLLLALPIKKKESIVNNSSNSSEIQTQLTSREPEIDIVINTSRTENSDLRPAASATVSANAASSSSLPSSGSSTSDIRNTKPIFNLTLPTITTSTRADESAPSTESERPPLSRCSSSKSALLSNRSKESLREPSPFPPSFDNNSASNKPSVSSRTTVPSLAQSLQSSADSQNVKEENTHHLIPSGSKGKLGILSFAGAGIASITSNNSNITSSSSGNSSRSVSSEPRGLFVSPRVLPQPVMTAEKPILLSEIDDASRRSSNSYTTAETSQPSVPSSPSFITNSTTKLPFSNNSMIAAESTSPGQLGTGIGIAEEGIAVLSRSSSNCNSSGRVRLPLSGSSADYASPGTTPITLRRTQSKEESPLALPLRAIQAGRMTPNSDRLPEHVGLSRG